MTERFAPPEADVDRARRLLRDANGIVVLTGAGVSAESGVPTFRGAGGLWRDHRPEKLATPEAFARDPLLVWSWYQWRRDLVERCEPNAAHHALAQLCSDRSDVRLVTQNVDGLHERASDAIGAAGATAVQPLTLHGSLFGTRCTGCGTRSGARSQRVDTTSVDTLPRCDGCGAPLRPDVVWFGESLDADVLETAFEAARASEVCFVIGTSALVQPAASIPLATLDAGGSIIEVNPGATLLSGLASVSLRAPAASTVPLLLSRPSSST